MSVVQQFVCHDAVATAGSVYDISIYGNQKVVQEPSYDAAQTVYRRVFRQGFQIRHFPYSLETLFDRLHAISPLQSVCRDKNLIL